MERRRLREGSRCRLLTAKKPDIFEYGNGPTLDTIDAGQVLDLTEQISAVKSDFRHRCWPR